MVTVLSPHDRSIVELPDETGLPQEQDTAKNLPLIPRPYQQDGIDYLEALKRGILWDQPGLGKTLIASEVAKNHLPALIAAPTYLTDQWFEHLVRQYPTHKIVLVDGTRKQRDNALASAKSSKADWTIINTEMLRIIRPSFTNDFGQTVQGPAQLAYDFPNVNTFVIDEAHHVRGREAKQSKGAEFIARRTPRVLLLTATPIYKAPDDLYQLLKIIDPQTFSSYYRFIKDHCKTIETGWGVKVVGASNSGRLKKVLDTYGLGRTYQDVGAQLPPIIKNTVVVRADKTFMERYTKVRSAFTFNARDVNSLMEAMHIMRRCTAEVKLQTAVELLEDDPEGIIFTKYVSTAKALASLLDCPCITGEIEADDRKKISRASKLIVANIDAMSEGVDLSHLNHCIFFEGDYVAAKLYQALSRVRRMRLDQSPVRVTYIYVKGTIDEIVHQAAQQRNSTITSVMKTALLGED